MSRADAGACPAAEGPRLLITEDDVALRQMLTWEFEELGYRVTAVGNCADTLAVIDRGFDLALLDYNLPDGTGSELLQLLCERSPGLPVYVCSGRGAADRAAVVRDCGGCGFLPKPVTARQLHRLFCRRLGD